MTGAGGPAGIQALKLLKGIPGVLAYGTDVDALSAGRFFAQDFATMSRVSDQAAYRDSLLALVNRWDIRYVLPTVSEELVSIHEALSGHDNIKLLTSPRGTLALCHDKRALYAWMAERLPIYMTRWQSADQVPTWEAESYFIKPAIGRGARGCRTISRRELDVLREAELFSADTLLMELLPGTEWTVDAYVTATGDVPMLITRERVALTGGISLKGRTVHHPKIREATLSLLKQMPTFGPTCIQWKADTEGKIKLLEVNPRLSGGVMISAAAGADPLKCLVEELRSGTVAPVAWRDVTVIRSFEERVLEDQQ